MVNPAQIVLTQSDVPKVFTLVESKAKAVADVSKLALEHGWQDGYVARFISPAQDAEWGKLDRSEDRLVLHCQSNWQKRLTQRLPDSHYFFTVSSFVFDPFTLSDRFYQPIDRLKIPFFSTGTDGEGEIGNQFFCQHAG